MDISARDLDSDLGYSSFVKYKAVFTIAKLSFEPKEKSNVYILLNSDFEINLNNSLISEILIACAFSSPKLTPNLTKITYTNCTTRLYG